MNSTETESETTIKETEKESVKKRWKGIYGLKRIGTDKWYVGYSSDIEGRWETAYKALRCKGQRKIYRALLKYGYDGFEKVILEECDGGKEVWGKRETHWISVKDSIKNGYNIAPGGMGGALHTMPHTDESKRKMSERLIGCKLSESHKEHIRRGLVKANRIITDEQRIKMLAGRRKVTDEEKREGNRRRTAEWRARIKLNQATPVRI